MTRLLLIALLLKTGIVLCQDSQLEKQLAVAMERARKAEASARACEYLEKAKNTAQHALQVDDPQLSGLLAVHAYRFNQQYGGDPGDAHIYAALMHAFSLFNIQPGKWRNIQDDILAVDNTCTFAFARVKLVYLRLWTAEQKFTNPVRVSGTPIKAQIHPGVVTSEGYFVLAQSKNRSNLFLEVFSVSKPVSNPERIKLPVSNVQQIISANKENAIWILGDHGQRIWYYDFSSLREVVKSTEEITALTINQNDSLLIGAVGGKILGWTTKDYVGLTILAPRMGTFSSIMLGANDKAILAGKSNGDLWFVRLFDRKPKILYGHRKPVDQIVFDHSKKSLLTVDRDHQALVWNWQKINAMPKSLPPMQSRSILAFTSNNDSIIYDKGFVWPLSLSAMAKQICPLLNRNLTLEEWEFFFPGLMYERTCPLEP